MIQDNDKEISLYFYHTPLPIVNIKHDDVTEAESILCKLLAVYLNEKIQQFWTEYPFKTDFKDDPL